MAQGHLDRLSVIDNSFLEEERGAAHMHVGAVLLFEGPQPAYEDVLEHFAGRLHLVPRYRQKVLVPRYDIGRPRWVDDPSFNLEYHVRHTALPPPGSRAQLQRLAGRIFSQRLDRSKPMWEAWLVSGLEDGGFALIPKSHHAMIDGISGADISTVIFDFAPEGTAVPLEDPPWTPQREPSDLDVALQSARERARLPLRLAQQVLGATRDPDVAVRSLRDAVAGLVEVGGQFLAPAPATPLNVPIGPHRRVAWTYNHVADFKAIKDVLGGTINDVVLTVTAGALRRWLQQRRASTDQPLNALVPVSTRTDTHRGALGNVITLMRGPLPVHVEDPVERLAQVRAAMDVLKTSKQAVGASTLASLEEFAPPTLLAQASRLQFTTRLFNLIVTNVPGPQFPLYLRGARLSQLIPVAFLPGRHALAVAIMSYDGKLNFGLLGDYDALHDIDDVARYLEDEREALLARATTGA